MPYRHKMKDQDWERIKEILPPENIGEGNPWSGVGKSRWLIQLGEQ